MVGLWVSAEGLCGCTIWSLHLIDLVRIPAEWRRIKSIDFGSQTPPLCCGSPRPDGDIHVYKQIYKTGMLVSDKLPR